MYTDYQVAILKLLCRTGVAPFALAGHWYYDRPLRGCSKIKAPSRTLIASQMIDKAWQLGENYAPVATRANANNIVGLKNSAQVLVSLLMWEILFPRDMHGEYMRATTCLLLKKSGFLEVTEESYYDWAESNLFGNDKEFYRILYDLSAIDCVRLSKNKELLTEYLAERAILLGEKS